MVWATRWAVCPTWATKPYPRARSLLWKFLLQCRVEESLLCLEQCPVRMKHFCLKRPISSAYPEPYLLMLEKTMTWVCIPAGCSILEGEGRESELRYGLCIIAGIVTAGGLLRLFLFGRSPGWPSEPGPRSLHWQIGEERSSCCKVSEKQVSPLSNVKVLVR